MNKVILIGNLSKDIELKYTPSGTAVAKFSLAVNRNYTDPTTKEKKQEVMFIDVTVFGRAGETARQYLKKGSKILIEGRLVLNQWTDQMGQKRSKHEVVCEKIEFLDCKNNNQGNYQTQQPQTQPRPRPQNTAPRVELDDDEIPF
jgi:single-strand DNA-binding protein